MDFSKALYQLKHGEVLSRINWDAKHMIKIQYPDDYSKMTLPYIYIITAQGDLVPWLASQTDLLVDDWFIIK